MKGQLENIPTTLIIVILLVVGLFVILAFFLTFIPFIMGWSCSTCCQTAGLFDFITWIVRMDSHNLCPQMVHNCSCVAQAGKGGNIVNVGGR